MRSSFILSMRRRLFRETFACVVDVSDEPWAAVERTNFNNNTFILFLEEKRGGGKNTIIWPKSEVMSMYSGSN